MDPSETMHFCKILIDRNANKEWHPCYSILPESENGNLYHVRVLTCSMSSGEERGGGNSVIDISDMDDSLPEGEIQRNGGSCNIQRLGKGHYIAMVHNPRCRMADIINRHACFLVYTEPISDMQIIWTVVGPSNTVIHAMLNEMRDQGFSFTLINSSKLKMNAELSDRQAEAVKLAVNLGYYDVPRRITLDSLSKLMGVSKSTFDVTLRNAEQTIMHYYVTMSSLEKTCWKQNSKGREAELSPEFDVRPGPLSP